MGRLDNKVAIISGAGKGQGAFEAALFASEGAKVVLADLDIESCESNVLDIVKNKGIASAVHLDVTSSESWINCIKFTMEKYQSIDILVNNAGIYSKVPIEEASDEEFDLIMSVNLKGVFLGTKYAIPEMRHSGGGSIINISSTAGLVGNQGGGAYGASIGVVRLFTKFTAIQHASDNIRANSVHPGPIDTDMIADNLSTPEGRQNSISRIPLGRIGTIEDVALGVLF